ncbi:MAG: transposase, partial [Cyanobacteria bacterium SW_4_48_29]
LGQWLREYDDDDLYGIAEPRTGASFFWEFSHLDNLGFGKFLKLFSQQYSESLNFIQLD